MRANPCDLCVMRVPAAVVIAMLALLPATADARSKPRPDLVVANGAVTAGGGQLTGSFTVKNIGRATAGKSKAALYAGRTVVKRFSVAKLKRSRSSTVKVSVAAPSGAYTIKVCADARKAVKESSEKDNCRRVGKVTAGGGPTGGGPPASTVPTDPVSFTANQPLTLDDSESNYWVNVPPGYDSTHQTPYTLFVWMHGCGGESSGDIYTISPDDRDWISVAVGGREDACWDVNSDSAKVLAAIASVKTHFNINPKRVIIGGYSSGGDLAYRTAFYNANLFAGLLAENTSPFRDTGSSADQSLAAAAW
jgi:predicted peptidase